MLKAYRNCILNHLVAHPLFAFVFYELAVNKIGMETSTSNLPTVGTMAKHILITLLVEDFLFYWIHRGLHHRLVYVVFERFVSVYHCTFSYFNNVTQIRRIITCIAHSNR